MRELKFRAWDKTENRFVAIYSDYSAFLDIETGKLYRKEIMYKYSHSEDGDEYAVESLELIDSVILMQYTGLLDKNGKEIYEGDVVRYFEWNGEHYDDKGLWAVSWDEYSPSMMIDQGGYSTSLEGITDDEYEVIGNVWENPDLV